MRLPTYDHTHKYEVKLFLNDQDDIFNGLLVFIHKMRKGRDVLVTAINTKTLSLKKGSLSTPSDILLAQPLGES